MQEISQKARQVLEYLTQRESSIPPTARGGARVSVLPPRGGLASAEAKLCFPRGSCMQMRATQSRERVKGQSPLAERCYHACHLETRIAGVFPHANGLCVHGRVPAPVLGDVLFADESDYEEVYEEQ